MKYALLPKAMWAVFAPSFKRELHLITDDAPQKIMTGAHKKYKEILSSKRIRNNRNEIPRDTRAADDPLLHTRV